MSVLRHTLMGKKRHTSVWLLFVVSSSLFSQNEMLLNKSMLYECNTEKLQTHFLTRSLPQVHLFSLIQSNTAALW